LFFRQLASKAVDFLVKKAQQGGMTMPQVLGEMIESRIKGHGHVQPAGTLNQSMLQSSAAAMKLLPPIVGLAPTTVSVGNGQQGAVGFYSSAPIHH